LERLFPALLRLPIATAGGIAGDVHLARRLKAPSSPVEPVRRNEGDAEADWLLGVQHYRPKLQQWRQARTRNMAHLRAAI
jgi:hypothetical protein